MPKINKDGTFLDYPGTTVISAVDSTNLDFWKELHQFLESELQSIEGYALLPYESFHMTTCHLYVKEDITEEWEQFLNQQSAFFTTLNERLNALNDFIPITIQLTPIVHPVLQLVVSIPQTHLYKLRSLAAFFGLENHVPDPFHITLAYQYKNIDAHTQQQLAENLSKYLAEKLSADTSPLMMNPPKLSYFKNMTEFTPWDGSNNPALNDTSPHFQP